MPARLLIFSSENADMRYASGLNVPDPFIWIRNEAKEYVLVSSLEYARVRQEARRGVKVLLLESVKLDHVKKPTQRRRNLADIAAAFLLSFGITEAVVPERCWAIHLETLREQGIRVRVDSPFFPERLIKTQEEIRHIKATGLVAKKALRHALQLIKDATIDWNDTLVHKGTKLTSEYLRNEIERIFLENGCISGETIVSSGEHSALPHHRGAGPLKAGEPIILDLFPRDVATGYYFDMTRTIIKGTPSPELKKMYDAVVRAQKAALAIAGPGKAEQIDAAARESMENAGFVSSDEEGFIHSTGHGLGLEIHELPRISEKSEDVLRPGMVVTIEPGLYYKELGGVRVEDTILITKDGCVNLTNLPRTLIVP